MEIFVPVVGFENAYMVSNLGNVYTKHYNRLMTPKKSKAGYYRVLLCDNGRRRATSVHRLVAEAFIDNPEHKPTVNHKNEDKSDNRVENLEWATNLEQNIYGTRIERAVAHTDWKARSSKMNYKEIAKKHDYNKQAMQLMKKTAVYRDGELIGIYQSQKDASLAAGVSIGKVSQCVLGQKKSCNGYKFERVDR